MAFSDKEVESPVGEGHKRIVRESVVIALWVLGLLTLLSLISYHPLDPGFFSKSYGNFSKVPANWVGNLGSYLADLLMGFFGFSSILFVPALIHCGLRILNKKNVLKALLWISIILSLSTLFSQILGEVSPFFYGIATKIHSGGLIGIILATAFSNLIGAIGTLIFFLLIALVSGAFLFNFSPFAPFSKIISPFQRFLENRKIKKEREKKEKQTRDAQEALKKMVLENKEKEPKDKLIKKNEIKKYEEKEELPLPLEADEDVDYKLPPPDLLDPAPPKPKYDEKELHHVARQIEEKLLEFDIPGEVLEIHPGPVVTIFEFKPAAGVKFSRIVQTSEDLAIRIKKEHVRIDRMGNKATIAIEIPNEERELIAFRELVESDEYKRNISKLPLALGKLVDGTPYVSSLTEMPHLLVAGTTGSGKSVGLNALINSILLRARPDEVKFIMIDPKQVELKIYEGLPHLLTPVVTDVKKAANAFFWVLKEMQERYKLFASVQVRSIEQYNRFIKTLTPNGYDGDIAETKPLPYIVIVIDELYDLMAVVAREVETAIGRLSAMARAVGIHLVIATQRPSRDVITGVIKSNLPARIAFQVREKLESRLILDQNGAETLEGKGDLLFLPPGSSRVIRIHGGYISTVETQRVIQYISNQAQPSFDSVVLKDRNITTPSSESEEQTYEDPLFKEAVKLVITSKIATASNLQRRMRLGYARAARLLDMMEEKGIVGPVNGAKPREILISEDEIDKWLQ
ncbi:MAG: DNA translocase FtsK 4TM domain-containing protein [Acidobacteria bacterium]|nr:DNA translocase FtsK 4TM domain-containing protein [Acidobacteriota bacterium]